jgi:tRNA dimethylallyltransferase
MEENIFPIQSPIVALIGPTAIGKTALSIELAKQFDFEIISVDSMQVYKYMDIGTAKISKEEMFGVPHHLINVVTPDHDFNAVTFENLAVAAIRDITARGKRVLLTGGTGLYLKSLIEGLSPQLPSFPEIRAEIQNRISREGSLKLHEQLHLSDRISAKRIHHNDTHRLTRALEIFLGTGKPWSELLAEHEQSRQLRFENILTLGLTCERKQLYQRIALRTEIMLANGFEKEVRNLLHLGYDTQHKSMRSIGYSHMIKYLQNDWTFERMIELLTRDTRRYAKRQFTWFKKIDNIHWVDKEQIHSIPKSINTFIKNC